MRRLHFAATLLLLGSVSAHAQPAASAALDELAARAAADGSVSVIINLAVPAQVEAALSAAGVARQRASIAAAQAALVSQALGHTQSSVKRNFATVPSIAAEVDANAMARLRASPLVQSIQEDALAAPTLAQSIPLVNAPTAWTNSYTGSGWAVAVLDTGVDKTHVILSGKVVSEACYSTTKRGRTPSTSVCPAGVAASTAPGSGVPCDTALQACHHGTHVAGIAAGSQPGGSYNGVAKDGNLIAMQVFSLFPDYQGSGQTYVLSYTSDQMAALERVYALRSSLNIAAVNMSLGGGAYAGACDADVRKPLIDNLRAAGIATVISAGNDGMTGWMGAPACISTAVSVASSCDASGPYCSGTDAIAAYSNINELTSLVAPGSLITSSIPGNLVVGKHGTSMAAPHVAGAWAVLKQWQPGIGVGGALLNLKAYGVEVNNAPAYPTYSKKRLDLAFVGTAPLTPTQDLTVSKTGARASRGTVTSVPAGIACGADCSETYIEGTMVTLTAAISGGKFTGWSGACAGAAPTCTVTMDAVKSVTATFDR
jgi:hypothetical protein